MNMREILEARRDGRAHSAEEFSFLARGAAAGSVPDYQLAAWLMAAYLNPLSPVETADLTVAIADSGARLDLSMLPKPRIDKHSTGGVGDKTSLVLLPLLAACGATVVKMSGRGLGITGGTVDKLESVPGFRMDLSPEELVAQAQRIGIAITGQSPELAPADKALYALRDVTATVGSIPLIVSSIIGKKLAGGADTIVLDVKCGSGSFMPELGRARELAKALGDTAGRCGLNLRIAITDMDRPLGSAVGNSLEVAEAARVLRGEAGGRFRDLCVALAGVALRAGGLAIDEESGRARAEAALRDGSALRKAGVWFQAQGADPAALEGKGMPAASVVREVRYEGGTRYVSRVDARRVGEIVVALGGGRRQKEDRIDPGVGVLLRAEVGSRIEPGQPLASIHAATEEAARTAEAELRLAFSFCDDEPEEAPLILECH